MGAAVLLFELATGTDRFHKDINRDNMINKADRQVISFVASDLTNAVDMQLKAWEVGLAFLSHSCW